MNNIVESSKYCVLAGMGRSGTNYLLDLLDLSSTTICRNEPDEILGSQFCNLNYKNATHSSEIPTEFKEAWLNTLNDERSAFSIRDRKFGCNKDFIKSAWGNAFASWLLSGQGKRNVLKWIWPSLSGVRYSLPHLLIDDNKLKDATLVIKSNMKLGWMLYLVDREPSVSVFHIIRHPAGYFSSMKHRYIAKVGEEAARKGAIERLESIAVNDPNWRKKFNSFGSISQMSMVELSICWWWCFNETLYLAAKNNDQYLSMRFEDVVSDPLLYAENIYLHAGIEDVTESLKRAEKLEHQDWKSKQRRNNYMNPDKGNIDSWRKKLSEQEVDVALQILQKSIFNNMWDAD